MATRISRGCCCYGRIRVVRHRDVPGRRRWPGLGQKPRFCPRRAGPGRSPDPAHTLRDDRRGLNFHFRLGLDEPGYLDGSHRREVLAHDLAINRTDLLEAGAVLGTASQIPGHPGDVLRAAARLRENREHILQRLRDLIDEARALEFAAARVPAHLAGYEYLPAVCHHAVAVARRARPALGLQDA